MLRAANKPVLADAIWNMTQAVNMPAPPIVDMSYVLDGRSLIQRLPWPRDATFDSICNMYGDYVVKKYNKPTVVFDGYGTGPPTKDAAHLRRSGGVVGAEVNFVGSMPLKSKKDHFLANDKNKQRFINMLSKRLTDCVVKTIHAVGDADLLICQTAVDSASRSPTTLIGEDTDLLVLLCFHANPNSFDLYFRSEAKQTSKKPRTWNIKVVKQALGQDTCYLLPFLHALTGCDTTSRLFGIGKGLALKKPKSNEDFKKQGEVFSRESDRDEIFSAGQKALSCLYGGSINESLDELRYRRFREKVSTKTSAVQVHTLPPTAAAARYHSARVYLQVQQWMDKGSHLNPEEWGWLRVADRLEPMKTDLPAAPDTLLKVIRCNCKTYCDTRKCTCKKLGLECSVMCGECKGMNCLNSPKEPIENLNEEL